MKFFYYNPELKHGYFFDDDDGEGAAAVGYGIGIYVAMYIIAALITAILIVPFWLASGFDELFLRFIDTNKTFIIIMSVIVIIIKLFTINLSKMLFVRFLFSSIIILPILYYLLYHLHFADFTIIIGKKFEVTSIILKTQKHIYLGLKYFLIT